MIPRFIWVLLIIVEFVLGRAQRLAGVAPLNESVTFGSDGSAQGSARICMKGMIANTGIGVLQNRNQADSID